MQHEMHVLGIDIPTVSLGATYVVAYTYGCDDGRISPTRCAVRRCSRAVDSMSDGLPKLVAIDEEAHDQIVHGGRFGEADRPADKSLNAGSQIDVLDLN